MTKIESEQNKKIFAKNFNYYLVKNGKTQTDIVKAFGLNSGFFLCSDMLHMIHIFIICNTNLAPNATKMQQKMQEICRVCRHKKRSPRP